MNFNRMLGNNVVLIGGLGNQIFQWAYGHGLYSTHDEIKFNLIAEKRINWEERPYSLAPLERKCRHIGRVRKTDWPRNLAKIRQYAHLPKFKYIAKLANTIGVTAEKKEFSNEGCDSPELGTYHVGYWQNSSYVDKSEKLILSELTSALDEVENLQELGAFDSYIAIHLRRGDYSLLQDSFGMLDDKYYIQALSELGIEDIPRVIFSDDIFEAKKLANKLGNCLVFGPQKASPWQVIKSLAYSNNAIIANSSLSWWGGWINSQRNGTTIMPETWFRDGRVPSESLRIKNAIKIKSYWVGDS